MACSTLAQVAAAVVLLQCAPPCFALHACMHASQACPPHGAPPQHLHAPQARTLRLPAPSPPGCSPEGGSGSSRGRGKRARQPAKGAAAEAEEEEEELDASEDVPLGEQLAAAAGKRLRLEKCGECKYCLNPKLKKACRVVTLQRVMWR